MPRPVCGSTHGMKPTICFGQTRRRDRANTLGGVHWAGTPWLWLRYWMHCQRTIAAETEVITLFNKAMTAVVKYQDKKTGLWYDVMDVTDPRNYLEATCSSMFAYCLLKGYRKGYISEKFRDAGVKAYNGIINNFIRVNEDKTISLTRCCSVSGLGPDKSPNRDGSFEYYMSEPIRDNDAKRYRPVHMGIFGNGTTESTNR